MKTVVTLFILLAAIAGTGVTQDSLTDEIPDKADSLYTNFEEREALETYNRILSHDPDNYTALWRASFLYARIGNRLDEDRRQKYYNRAVDLAAQALSVDSSDTQSNFVMSVALGRKAMISGPQERVTASRAIKRYAELAIKLDSTNAGAWHVLGRWHFKVANLSLVERLAAEGLFGGIPDASENKAVQYLEKAIALNPHYVRYYYDLAEMYRQLGNNRQAITACRNALQQEPLSPDDPKLQQECKNLIETLR